MLEGVDLQDELYTPYLGQLAKLAFLASAVHQAIFTMFSTLPFAVGQVGPAHSTRNDCLISWILILMPMPEPKFALCGAV